MGKNTNIETIKQIELAKKFMSEKSKERGLSINHLLDVLAILQNEFHINDEELLVSAVLHDTLENTNTTYEELEKTFSKNIADLVQEISHPVNYNEKQKIEFYEHCKHISPKAKIIRLADFTSNLRYLIKIRKSKPEKPYHDQFIILIRAFLDSCPDSEAKDVVYKLTEELEVYVTEKFQF